jgi:hypothetical protein
MFIRGWSPFAGKDGRPIPLADRKFLSSVQCGTLVETVKAKVNPNLWSLVESVSHSNMKNWQIVLSKKSGAASQDFWALQESINAYLKGESIMVLGWPVYASMEQSPAKQERNALLRAGERAVKALALNKGLNHIVTSIAWPAPGHITAKSGNNPENVIAVFSKKKGALKWDEKVVASMGFVFDDLMEAYDDSLDF